MTRFEQADVDDLARVVGRLDGPQRREWTAALFGLLRQHAPHLERRAFADRVERWAARHREAAEDTVLDVPAWLRRQAG